MDVANITTLITALRNETEKQSISPENVGYLLQIIVDFCNEQDLSLSETVETLAVKLDSRVAILESKDSEQDSDILQIRVDVDSLSENLKAHDTTLTNHSQSIAMNTEDITNLNALVESAQEAAERAGASAEANKSQIDTLRASTESHGSEITQLQATMVSHGQAVDELSAENDEQDERLAACEDTDGNLAGWHKAHSIINLHSFIDQPTVESSVFPEYMVNVPSGLIQNGCIVMIYTLTGWEAWQLVDKEASLTSLDGYKQLGWDNAQILSDITQLQIAVVSHGQAIDELAAKNDEQDASLAAQYSTLETHILDFEEDIVGAKFNDAKGTLFERVIALEASVKSLEERLTVVENRQILQ